MHYCDVDIAAKPSICPNYLSTEEDKQTAIDSLRLTRRIVQQAALKEVVPVEHLPGLDHQTDQQLLAAAGSMFLFMVYVCSVVWW